MSQRALPSQWPLRPSCDPLPFTPLSKDMLEQLIRSSRKIKSRFLAAGCKQRAKECFLIDGKLFSYGQERDSVPVKSSVKNKSYNR